MTLSLAFYIHLAFVIGFSTAYYICECGDNVILAPISGILTIIGFGGLIVSLVMLVMKGLGL